MGTRAPEDRHERRERLIRRVLAGVSHPKLATEFNVTERTIRGWLRRPKIRERIEQAVDAALGSYTRRLVATAAKAHGTLLKLLADESSQVRLGAARSLVAPLEKLIELRLTLAKRDAAEVADYGISAKSLEQLSVELREHLATKRGVQPAKPHEGNGQTSGNGQNDH